MYEVGLSLEGNYKACFRTGDEVKTQLSPSLKEAIDWLVDKAMSCNKEEITKNDIAYYEEVVLAPQFIRKPMPKC